MTSYKQAAKEEKDKNIKAVEDVDYSATDSEEEEANKKAAMKMARKKGKKKTGSQVED